jgi:hypothetical protein
LKKIEIVLKNSNKKDKIYEKFNKHSKSRRFLEEKK